MSTDELIKAIRSDIEWLETTNNVEVECISIENLETILALYTGVPIKLSEE